MRTAVLRALAIATALLPVAGTARAGWLSAHSVARYETADLEFVVRHYRPEIINLREGRYFTSPQGQEARGAECQCADGFGIFPKSK